MKFTAIEPHVYRGLCNASAAIALDAERFVVADDEVSVLKVYRFDAPGLPLEGEDIDLHAFLGGKEEADLEGGALVGDTIYWIGSHGADGDGKPAPGRRVLFATRRGGPGERLLVPQGQPCRRLLDDLAGTPAQQLYDLLGAAGQAPKDPGGLSIEGLADTPEGHLLIGLRNPVPADGALLLILENPAEVVAGKPARFGPHATLDLGGQGIRSIERHGDSYYVVAGPPGKGKQFAVYRWSGVAGEPPQRLDVPQLAGLNPEALFFDPAGTLHILSDDGKDQPGGVKCKHLPVEERQFRRIALGLA
ncbi:DUF3616 domain-containing protein [Pseudoduganella armeniaca]|uniref:DUF3616 domain-containing protein n=1 Tax=Pseudoduganella armeniaca TaxID=2072590 RepID=A0A2R4CBN9_9BURK|nr:DUF3616 domain-containing protein [Pseudoduganella armeniaca]AVR97021.1 DUF3616 domain-containing protein [Pseudoduganella armeniaca]